MAAQSGGEGSYDDPKNDYLTNGYGTLKLAQLAKEIRCKKFIYTSTVAVYGNSKNIIKENSKINPDAFYGISKVAGEMFFGQTLKIPQQRHIYFVLFNTFGPGEDLKNTQKGMVGIYSYYLWQNKPIIIKGSPNRFRNFVYIDDCINILFNSLNNKYLNNFENYKSYISKKVTLKKNLLK